MLAKRVKGLLPAEYPQLIKLTIQDLRSTTFDRDLPAWRFLRFMLRGFRPQEVIRYGLDQGADTYGYLNELGRLRLESRLACGADVLLHDKLVFHAALPALRELVCPLYGLVVDGGYMPLDDRGHTAAEVTKHTEPEVVERALKAVVDTSGAVVKPVRGGSKRNVVVLQGGDSECEDVILANGRPVDPSSLPALLRSHTWSIVTGYAEQGSYAAAIAPGLSNVLRVLTIKDREGGVELIRASHLFSTAESSAGPGQEEGALRAEVDPATGTLGSASKLRRGGRVEAFSHHPESGAVIEGVSVPGWKSVRAALTAAHEGIPHVRTISWDVVVTDQGPRVVEAERALSPRVFQRTAPLFDDPRFAALASEHGVAPSR